MKRTLIFMLAIFIIFTITACGKSDKKEVSTTSESTNSTSTLQKGGTDKSDSGETTLKNFEGNNPAMLSGSSNCQQKLSVEKGGYLFTVKTKDPFSGLKKFEISYDGADRGFSAYIPFAAGKDETGLYVYQKIVKFSKNVESTFKIEADGFYSIEINKLPLASGNNSFPASIKGNGARVFGPFECSGQVNIKLKTSDAKQAGFTAEFINADTGEQDETILINAEIKSGGTPNQFDVTKTVKPSAAGNYFIYISSNGGCEWEAEITK